MITRRLPHHHPLTAAQRNLLGWLGHMAGAGLLGGVIGVVLLIVFAYFGGFDLVKALS